MGFMERYSIMKRRKVSFALDVLRTMLLLGGFALLMLGLSMWIGTTWRHYSNSLTWTRLFLNFSRENIRLFADQTGRFPESLQELNEYAERHSKIYWTGAPREYISGRHPDSSEHADLDGTGGLYYNPKTGVLKVNLTKPLKSYWRFYFGKRRDEVPADW